jgi:hypothetical protein
MRKSSSPGGIRSFSFQKALFEQVAQSYVETKNLSPVTASNPDIDAPLSKKLSFIAVDFLVDVERATEQALKDFPDLQKTWFQLVNGDLNVDPKLAEITIRLTAMVYHERSLDPALYFRTLRRGRAIQKEQFS